MHQVMLMIMISMITVETCLCDQTREKVVA